MLFSSKLATCTNLIVSGEEHKSCSSSMQVSINLQCLPSFLPSFLPLSYKYLPFQPIIARPQSKFFLLGKRPSCTRTESNMREHPHVTSHPAAAAPHIFLSLSSVCSALQTRLLSASQHLSFPSLTRRPFPGPQTNG
jgi:hypothetical protein